MHSHCILHAQMGEGVQIACKIVYVLISEVTHLSPTLPAVGFCASSPPNHHTVNGRCVFVETLTSRSWFTAREDCSRRYGDLLTIDSQATLTALTELLNDKLFSSAPYWVGLVGRQWLWQNGQWLSFLAFCCL